MTSIQSILVVLSLLGAILASVAFQSRLGYRLLAVLFFAGAGAFVIFPGGTTRVAHALGVGRGADLLLYLGIFAGIHALLLMYVRTDRLEWKLTKTIRAIAIRDALDRRDQRPEASSPD